MVPMRLKGVYVAGARMWLTAVRGGALRDAGGCGLVLCRVRNRPAAATATILELVRIVLR